MLGKDSMDRRKIGYGHFRHEGEKALQVRGSKACELERKKKELKYGMR